MISNSTWLELAHVNQTVVESNYFNINGTKRENSSPPHMHMHSIRLSVIYTQLRFEIVFLGDDWLYIYIYKAEKIVNTCTSSCGLFAIILGSGKKVGLNQEGGTSEKYFM